MNAFLYFSALVASCIAAPQIAYKGEAPGILVRAPAHDSASIEHHRLGGNFAYSTAEAHAFAEVRPQISTLTHPVAETTNTHIPAPIATFQPAPIVKTTHVAQPIFKNIPTFGTQQISGPVRTHQTIHQPLVHETRTHTQQAVSQAFATPLAQTVARPVAVESHHVQQGVALAQVNTIHQGVAPVAVGHAGLGYAGAAGLGYAGHAGLGYAGHAGLAGGLIH